MASDDPNSINEEYDALGDGIDYSDKFWPRITFETVEAAFSYANNIALDLGFNLIKYRNVKKHENLKFHYCVCEHYGSYESVATQRKNTTTKKCGCKFEIRLIYSDGRWAIFPGFGRHNHPFIRFKEGHRRLTKFSPDQKTYLTAQKKQHVSPAKIMVGYEKEFPDSVMPNKRQIYNFTWKVNVEIRGERNPAQQMLHQAVEAEYVFFTEIDPVTNVLKKVFMVHPVAVKLFRAWPHVIIIDSTYRTNKYGMPVVEIIGVSPTKLNFLIAYVLVMDEKIESYSWILERLRDVLLGGHPDTIVTDRELGLISAISAVFPESKHVLCLWHVYTAVEARALFVFKECPNKAKRFVRHYFHKLVEATSEDEFDFAWTLLSEKYGSNKRHLVSYLVNTWGKYVQTWSKLHTNRVFHLGNTSTGRVESAHSLMKGWLGTATHGLDTFWAKVHDMIEGQQREIRSALEASISRGFSMSRQYGNLFSLLRSRVSKEAIVLMRAEYDRGNLLGDRLDVDCGHSISTTHGLLCACVLHRRRNEGRMVHVDDLHKFWSTLDYEPPNLNESAPNDALEDMFTRIRGSDAARQRVFLESMNVHVHPEETCVTEPNVVEVPRGRPRNSTTRNRSFVEHARRRFPYTSPGTSGPSTTRRGDVGPGPPSNINFVVCPLESFPEGYFIPAVVSGYFDAYFNPVGDGHCGFRCISSAAVGDEGDWHNMRTQLLVEITKPVYRNIYEVALIDPFSRISCSPNTGFVGLQNWMIGEDLFGYATIFNWAICCISVSYHSVTSAIQWTGSATYLPLRAPSGVQGPYGVMWILHTGDHYIRVRFEGDVPMPPIHFLWHTNRHDAIVDWDLLYASNIERWHSAFGFDTGFVDLSDDDG